MSLLSSFRFLSCYLGVSCLFRVVPETHVFVFVFGRYFCSLVLLPLLLSLLSYMSLDAYKCFGGF